MNRLLQGTGLTYSTGRSGAITIKPLPDASDQAGKEGLYSGEIVVTGLVEKTSKFKTSYAISTLSQEQAAKSAPQNTADLIGNLGTNSQRDNYGRSIYVHAIYKM